MFSFFDGKVFIDTQKLNKTFFFPSLMFVSDFVYKI